MLQKDMILIHQIFYLLTSLQQMHEEEQKNMRLRQIRKKQCKIHAQQKKNFQLIFKNNPMPNFLERGYYSSIIYGIPTEFRIYLWPQLIPNHYNITPPFYYGLVQQLQLYRNTIVYKSMPMELEQTIKNPEDESNNNESKISKWLKIIQQDIPRTFPQLKIFHKDAQQYKKLLNILGCFSIFRHDIGYVQGLSSIAALLLQQLSTQYRAFTALSALITTNSLIQFFSFDNHAIDSFCQRVELKLSQFLLSFEIQLKMVIVEWIITLFTRCFQFDSILKMWDILLVNHMSFTILQELCTAITIIRRQTIYRCSQAFQIIKLLKNTKLCYNEEEIVFLHMRNL